MSEQPLLEVRRLVKHFRAGGGWFKSAGAVRAVDDVSLSIDRGTALALVGESGSGKTTLGRVILRLIDPTGGSVSFDGTDVLGLKPAPLRAFRRRMQIVFQDPAGSLNPRMRVGTAVREPIEVHGLAKGTAAKDRVASLFSEVGLDPDLMDRYPHELSGGQKQRVGIARALSVEPDNATLAARVDEIRALRADGKPTLPTTIAREKQTNPFLRADDPGLASALGMAGAEPAAVFAEVRGRKDRF